MEVQRFCNFSLKASQNMGIINVVLRRLIFHLFNKFQHQNTNIFG